MPRLMSILARPLFSAHVEGHGTVRVIARGRLRQLWFVDGTGEAHLQTEVVCRDAGMPRGADLDGPAVPCTLDMAASLRRTPYLRYMARRILDTRPRRVLVLGLGGGLLPMALSTAGGAQISVVEQSALVCSLASRFFAVPQDDSSLDFRIHLGDAEEFVRHRAPDMEPFDACAIDIFQSHTYRLPSFVLSGGFHAALRTVLRPGARVVQNALAHGGHVEGVAGAMHLPREELGRCLVWRRGAAPRGPLWPGIFLRRNAAAEQLALLEGAFREAYGAAKVHTPCAWAPSRIVEADLA